MNIGFITNSPAPYRTNQLNKFCEIADIRINVYYTNKNSCRNWNIEEKSKASEFFLKGVELFKSDSYEICANLGLGRVLKENDLMMIGGYEQLSCLILSFLCKVAKKPYILLFDGIQPQKIGARTSLMKKAVISVIVKNAKAIFANGTAARQYFMKNYGYDGEKIFNQYLTCDIERIQKMKLDKAELKKQIKNRYAVSEDKFVILCVSRLVKFKNIKLLIEAVSLLDASKYSLMIVGDGTERSNLEHLAVQLNVEAVFTGNVADAEKVYMHYMAADLFVFPTSHECWGLVINEAMASGLPILCSTGAGASMDLVHEGRNGYLFSPDDAKALSLMISHLMNDAEKCKRFGLMSERIIHEWTYEHSKRSFSEILKHVNLLN